MVGIEKGYKWILGYCLFRIILLALETACMVAGYESINFITMAIVCLTNTAFTVGYFLAVNRSAGNSIMLKIWGVCHFPYVVFPFISIFSDNEDI